MQCPNCKKENSPENSYCIFCGSVLPAPDVQLSVETVPGDKDVPPGEVRALREEMQAKPTYDVWDEGRWDIVDGKP